MTDDVTWAQRWLQYAYSAVSRKQLEIEWVSCVLRPHQHSIGYTGDGFYRSKDPTNSIKVLKEMLQNRKKTTKIHIYIDNNDTQNDMHKISTASSLVYNNMGWDAIYLATITNNYISCYLYSLLFLWGSTVCYSSDSLVSCIFVKHIAYTRLLGGWHALYTWSDLID